MRRRTVMALLAALGLGGSAVLRRAVAALGPQAPEPTMAAIADTLFPGGDGLPGASALRLHERVLSMSDLQDSIGEGIAWLDKFAASRGAGAFVALDETGRLAALDASRLRRHGRNRETLRSPGRDRHALLRHYRSRIA